MMREHLKCPFDGFNDCIRFRCALWQVTPFWVNESWTQKQFDEALMEAPGNCGMLNRPGFMKPKSVGPCD